ncbi:MAG: mechanosensitive ion channel [Planctomycetaceae bacterium]|nr:mechanosensitive ion channel [Planctomycetaceae bacterium]MBT5124212.1 mechanosensitive ion channel [Planctomycetaceae bacterium]MBT5597336.1 mechanosensitive ion channel [Planctomycetaceae bacterium]MBT7918041.1 mechanosensitive ion channel [Planctomycetaceae bacterium]
MDLNLVLLFAAEGGDSASFGLHWLEGVDWVGKLSTFGVACLIMLAFYVVARILQSASMRVGASRHINQDLAEFMGRVVKVGVLMMGLVTALSNLGVDVSALVTGLGLTGFALGFALKDVISNVLAGVLILIYKPFVKSDYIKVKGHEGLVVSTDLRYTVLRDEAGAKLYIPNAMLFVDALRVSAEAPESSESS